ncbi:hypothetical protein DSM106972_046500 [Dulcicalothrix desertica PCC 7102]|uniref:DUF11 domain-containing protein n=1 Tax=Dulcicalothrix desertica PCC 7102 TaxID=232991 RepID=A0A433VE76_9CYAN|nr:DUF11 domain-containing protein [Dulcicalothrix desertica]RUT04422.1 hypothetical protein DSM106972_046500 [Dulcicalothrix desertica PCC 7102]TWH51272.1 putative repeat protein (TIGR01451 family)/fimbrial isopeptide formation D2 family protein [Dulcicalothrix desertica PCC 7102]
MKSLTNLIMRRQKRLLRTIGTTIATTTLLTSQSLWLLNKPVFADKVDGSGAPICAIPGKDGNITATTQLNTYYIGAGSNVAAGSTSVSVGAGTGASGIQKGDLLLIIQMQGADIDSTNTNSYGDGSATNNPNQGAINYPANGVVNGNLTTNFTAGNFEYAVAASDVGLSGGTITLTSPLVNSYGNSDFATQGQKRYQVIRVPQYNNLDVTGTIIATPWNGQTGGIVAVDVAGKLTFNGGQINANGLGFRGGAGRKLSVATGGSNTDIVTLSSFNANGSKAEGIAGTPRYLYDPTRTIPLDTTVEGYPGGSYGRGAPGNAGGGGTDGNPSNNEENAGGGGGSNGGLGGKGGKTWRSALPFGGDGGAVFPASARRLVLGGGGGAGSNNNGTGTPGNGYASSGAPGGGIVMVRAGTIAGTGTINADGATPSMLPANDGSGGGGAGGSVLVISQNSTIPGGITINASGGKGGTNTGGGSPHGPGGGGGGGAVYISPNTATINLSGGQPGTTNNEATNFGGATAGSGVIGPVPTTPTDATTSISGAGCLIEAAKTTSTPNPMAAPGTATYTITVSNPSGSNRPEAREVVIIDDSLPAGFTHTAVPITPVYTGGASGPTTVTSTGTASKPEWKDFTIPPGGSVSITFNADIANGTAPGKYNNSVLASAKYVNPSAGVTTVPNTAVTVSTTYDGTVPANTGEDVTIIPSSTLTADKTVALVVDSDKSGGTTPLQNQVPTPGDILEYTVVVKNTSTTISRNNVVLKDTIPPNTTYVSGTLEISAGANDGAKSDTSANDQAEFAGSQVVFRLGTGASSTTGGTLGTTAADSTSTIKFRVKVNDPLANGVTTVSNQAVISSDGVGDIKSDDPVTPTVSDPTISKIAPRVRLVKRITGVKKFGSATVASIGGYNDLAADVNDDTTVGWTPAANTYLLGAITGNQIPVNPGVPAPKDEVEYTIYFLVDGGIPAQSLSFCDFVPANQTYVSGTMQLNLNGGATNSITDNPPSAGESGFYTVTFPAACSGTNNNRGAAYFQVGNSNSGSYGFIRFRATID